MRERRNRTRVGRTTAFHALFAPIALIWMIPVIATFTISLLPTRDPTTRAWGLVPNTPSLSNYALIFKQNPILRHMVNSLTVTVPSVVLTVVLGAPPGFGRCPDAFAAYSGAHYTGGLPWSWVGERADMSEAAQVFASDHLEFGVSALALTMGLCFLLGLERHYHLKDAGVKTHVLVGMGSCLFTLVSIYGFTVPDSSTVALDPSRLAAQIVSGIGFLGAGVIFVNNDTVKGLTTAATVWVSAAIGVACGAGMGAFAVATLLLHFFLIFVIGPLVARLPSSHRNDRVVIEYESDRGVMRRILVVASTHGYTAEVNSTEAIRTENGPGMRVVMRFDGPYPQDVLLSELGRINGVNAVDRLERSELD